MNAPAVNREAIQAAADRAEATATKAPKLTPVTTQGMYQLAFDDWSYADTMARIAREDSTTPRDIVARRESTLRLRRAILNAMDFLITNDADIAAVMKKRRG